MRAVSRFGIVLLAGAFALAPTVVFAQEAPPATSDAPAVDSIGPKDLQNFSLNGTITRAADQPPATAPAQARRSRDEAQPVASSTEPARAPAVTARQSSAPSQPAPPTQTAPTAVSSPAQQERAALTATQQPPPASSPTVALPNADIAGATPDTASSAVFPPDPATGTLAPEHKFPVLPWLLAALLLVLGGAFLFWRNRGREAFAGAGGPHMDAFVAPEPTPAPRRAPAPPPPASKPAAPTPATSGVVSARLRPWIDIGFQPLRCVLDDERVTVEFNLELFNSGSGPARAVLAEASLFNAGETQDREIGAFFANPVGQGERIAVIPPLKRISIRTQVVAPRLNMRAYELAGRQVFVPVIAFNALYSWSGGEGQTSVSYLLGRDTHGEKMGPFRLDLGPRIFRGVATRLLPVGVRK